MNQERESRLCHPAPGGLVTPRPASASARLVRDAQRPPQPPTAGGYVLVVDDDERILAVAKAILQQEGFEVATASDGTEARRLVTERVPDLIVSDVMLLDVDGFSLVEYLRDSPRRRTIPLVFLVAAPGAGDIGDGLDLGADAYVRKPLRPAELAASVRAMLDQTSVPEERLDHSSRNGVLSRYVFREELRREISRAARAGQPGVLAKVELNELLAVHSRLGNRAVDAVAQRFAEVAVEQLRPLDVVGRLDRWRFGILLPDISEDAAERRLDDLARRLVRARFEVLGETLRFTPTLGFAGFRGGEDPVGIEQRAALALGHAVSRLEVRRLVLNRRCSTRRTPPQGRACGCESASRRPCRS